MGLRPSGGCWWEVRDKFWLLSGPLPTAVPWAMAAPPTGRWSGLQLSLPKEISGTSTREHLHGNANAQKAALCLETDVSEVDVAWHRQVTLRRHVGLLYLTG